LSPKSVIWVIFIFLCGFPSVIPGAQYSFIPSVSLKQTYDDNVYLYWKEEKGDFLTYIQPKVMATFSTERMKVDGNVQVNILRYADETNLNTEEQTYRLGLNYLKSERLAFSLSGRYIKDTTLESEWTETGIGLVRNIRKNYGGNGSVSYYLTERDSITLLPFYARSEYESPSYIDYWFGGTNLVYEHRLSNERISLNAQLGYNYFKSALGHTHNCLVLSGLNYIFSETMKVSILAGLRYSDSKIGYKKTLIYYPFIISYTETRKEKKVGGLVNISFNKQIERGSFILGAERDIIPSSFGEMIERNRVYLNVIYKFTERWGGSFLASYYNGCSSGDIKTIDYYSYNLRPSLHFFLTKYSRLELSYWGQYYKSKLTNFDASRNVILLGITWSKPYQWQ